MEVRGTSAGKKEFMVDGLLADIGIGVVLPIRSSNRLLHLDCQKRFPMYQSKFNV